MDANAAGAHRAMSEPYPPPDEGTLPVPDPVPEPFPPDEIVIPEWQPEPPEEEDAAQPSPIGRETRRDER